MQGAVGCVHEWTRMEPCAASPAAPRASTCRLPKRQALQHSWERHVALESLLASLATNSTHYFHAFDLFCDKAYCSALVPGTLTVAYQDRQHLSTAGALYLAPFLNCWLAEKGLV